jgi:hypothetical protein
MVGERGLGVNPLVDRSYKSCTGCLKDLSWERNRNGKTNNLLWHKPSSVKLQEILSWKCPSAFLVWEFMGGN